MEIAKSILEALKNNDTFSSLKFAKSQEVTHSEVVSQLLSLSSSDIVRLSKNTEEKWELTEEGNEMAENGSYEYRLYTCVPDGGISLDELKTKVPKAEIGLNKAIFYKWVKMAGTPPIVQKNVHDIFDVTCKNLNQIKAENIEMDKKQIDELKKRKLIKKITITSYNVTRGDNFDSNLKKKETDLTYEMVTR
ncbi:Phenylalanine--tRNA ligase alpha subunit B [Thelohanellus kitauei]|uniref:Phenylalanine--tRNA ligase alpha subunit B n=1 Tax=Thelohanellus kitauei TaxID=669202 RepID=A0A0C2JUW9_THEKT|nr:Phenylalanine--tRNA ligase alpha subunit B [Thelohanellus kitauei]